MSFRKAALAASLLVSLPLLAQQAPTLKDRFQNTFAIGAAINEAQFSGKDTLGAAIIRTQFNSITPENALKWENIHPQPDHYDFGPADQYVRFGQQNHMLIVGHTLVWHNQTPAWVFQDSKGNPVDRDTLLHRMKEHIHTVVGRYKGRIQSWDVVNEALEEDGTLRPSPWLRILGEDYIAKAFQYAHEADPQAQLNYNDYSLENEPKRKGALALIARLRAQGIPVTAVGLQGHNTLSWPTAKQEEETIEAFAALGVKIVISELDIDVLPRATAQQTAEVSLHIDTQSKAMNPYAAGLPPSVQQTEAKRYAELFAIYHRHRSSLLRVTLWGVTDGDSWLNDWPIKGRTSYPLLFDRNGKPKPAFDAVLQTVPASQK